jgi:hypothetical protein
VSSASTTSLPWKPSSISSTAGCQAVPSQALSLLLWALQWWQLLLWLLWWSGAGAAQAVARYGQGFGCVLFHAHYTFISCLVECLGFDAATMYCVLRWCAVCFSILTCTAVVCCLLLYPDLLLPACLVLHCHLNCTALPDCRCSATALRSIPAGW